MKLNWKTKSWNTASVRPHFAKPPVCVQRSCLCDESRPLDGRSGATSIRQLADCMLCCSKGQGSEHIRVAQCRLYNRCVCMSRSASWRRSGCEVSIIVTDAKRNDAHDCFDWVNFRYRLPVRRMLCKVLTASGIKPPGLTDRRKGGTGELVLVEYAE